MHPLQIKLWLTVTAVFQVHLRYASHRRRITEIFGSGLAVLLAQGDDDDIDTAVGQLLGICLSNAMCAACHHWKLPTP